LRFLQKKKILINLFSPPKPRKIAKNSLKNYCITTNKTLYFNKLIEKTHGLV